MVITQEEWDYLWEKYENLVYSIALKINGDFAGSSSFEDNVQDLQHAMLLAVQGFENQGTNGKPSDFIKTRGFDKYIKTVLWTAKAKKGASITKRKDLLNYRFENFTKTGDIDGAFLQDLEGELRSRYERTLESRFSDSPLDFSEIFDDEMKLIVDNVVKDPMCCLKQNGSLNVAKISGRLGWSIAKTTKVVDRLKKVLSIS